ncbi:MAG: HAD hydrolase-like protein [Desulfovibrio sp.]|nr:HAD hydrolase-like protein [Desulfovibrio sp.]
MPPRFQTVLFDLDGTLTDSAEGILNSVQHALKAIGREIPREETRFMIGPPLKEGFAKLLGDPELALRCVALYREYFRSRGIFENRVYPGVPAMLKSLGRAGVRTAVATSKPEPFARRIVWHFGLAPWLADVSGADMQGPVQAKKDVIVRCLQRLHVSLQGWDASEEGSAEIPAEAGMQDPSKASLHGAAGVLMVGDRHYDVAGAHEAGLACAGVLYGYGSREELACAGADYLCGSPRDIVDVALGSSSLNGGG